MELIRKMQRDVSTTFIFPEKRVEQVASLSAHQYVMFIKQVTRPEGMFTVSKLQLGKILKVEMNRETMCFL